MQVEQRVLDAMERYGYNDAESFAVKLSMEESLANAIKHGNRYDPQKQVEIHFEVDHRKTVITVIDEGNGFDPQKIPDPTRDENLEKPSGRGIMLIRAYMDEVQYNDRGNQICMIKRKTTTASSR